MRKDIKFILMAVLMVMAISLSGQSYNEYEMVLVNQFEIGSGINELGLRQPSSFSGYRGPSVMTFVDGQVLIIDTWNDRFTFFDRSFVFQDETPTTILKPEAGIYRIFQEQYLVGTAGVDVWSGISVDGTGFFSMSREDSPLPENRYRSYWYHNGVLFIHDKDNNLVSITDPSPISEENQFSFRNTEQTRALFEPDSDWDPQGLSVDDQDRLFLDGELVTLDFRTFADYWYDAHDGDMDKLSALGMRMRGDDYIGKDSDGNIYWRMYRSDVLVYNHEGKLIEWFLADSKKTSTLPAVSPEGDVYFMGYEEDAINIYRIDRHW